MRHVFQIENYCFNSISVDLRTYLPIVLSVIMYSFIIKMLLQNTNTYIHNNMYYMIYPNIFIEGFLVSH